MVLLVEETRVPKENQSTWRKPEYLEETRVPEENHHPVTSHWHYWWRKPEYLKKTTGLSQVTDIIGGGNQSIWRKPPACRKSLTVLVEETRVPGENHRPVASHWQTLSHNVYRVHLAWVGFDLTALVVIGTDCTGSLNPNTVKPILRGHLWDKEKVAF